MNFRFFSYFSWFFLHFLTFPTLFLLFLLLFLTIFLLFYLLLKDRLTEKMVVLFTKNNPQCSDLPLPPFPPSSPSFVFLSFRRKEESFSSFLLNERNTKEFRLSDLLHVPHVPSFVIICLSLQVSVPRRRIPERWATRRAPESALAAEGLQRKRCSQLLHSASSLAKHLLHKRWPRLKTTRQARDWCLRRNGACDMWPMAPSS